MVVWIANYKSNGPPMDIRSIGFENFYKGKDVTFCILSERAKTLWFNLLNKVYPSEDDLVK
jgi:hypothetical protein